MPDRIRVLELRSVWGTGGGPEKTILIGTERATRSRFAVTVCYIRDARDPVFGIDKRAGALDIDYVEVRERHSFDRSIWGALKALVGERRIDIVHSHDYKTNLLGYLLSRRTNVIPLAVPGRCRRSTSPPTRTRRPWGSVRSSPAATTRSFCNCGRTNLSGWSRSESPAVR